MTLTKVAFAKFQPNAFIIYERLESEQVARSRPGWLRRAEGPRVPRTLVYRCYSHFYFVCQRSAGSSTDCGPSPSSQASACWSPFKNASQKAVLIAFITR